MLLSDIRRRIFSPFMLVAVIAFSIIGAGVSYGLLISYKSRSVTWFQNSISEFRTLQEQVSSSSVLDRYLRDDKSISWGAELQPHILRSDNWMSPMFRYSKKDSKELLGQKDTGKFSDLIGYEINFSAADADTAQRKVELLTNYVSDAFLKIQIDNFIADSFSAKQLLLTSALLERDTEGYNLTLLEDRFNDLRRLSTHCPMMAGDSTQKIISIEKYGDRYMPLSLQMIALERERFDIKEKLAKTQRIVDGLPSEEAMLASHRKIAAGTNLGKDLALALIKDIQSRKSSAKKGMKLLHCCNTKTNIQKWLQRLFLLHD